MYAGFKEDRAEVLSQYEMAERLAGEEEGGENEANNYIQ
jgi:hypothetical protein